MSKLITDSHNIKIDSGCRDRVSVAVTSCVIELSAREGSTDHTILNLTPDQARELGTKLITFAAYAEANDLQMQS